MGLELNRTVFVALGLAWFTGIAAAPAGAVENCRAKIRVRDGAVLVVADGVGASSHWGLTAESVDRSFANGDSCYDADGGKLRGCLLGEAGTLAARTPPADCRLCIGDAGPGPVCCIEQIRRCTPGRRPGDDSFAAGDPRLDGPIDADTLGGMQASDFSLRSEVPNLSVTAAFYVNRADAAGSSTRTLVSTTRSLCFLTQTLVEETDANNEWARCDIYASGGYWYVRASLGDPSGVTGTNADVSCEARCLRW